MEYSVHGSMHGGSGHGGSLHSPFSAAYSGQSSSVPGFLTPRSEGEKAPIVSSLNSPLVKSTFKQLGGVEDGWLIEMYYKTSVTYQRSVVSEAGKKLAEVFKEIAELEETRCRKLHQVMLAFVPRQRRLYVALPEQMKGVLDDLVGLRIDEESLQTLVDESIKARSHNHLKNAGAHRSSIMNRSRLKVETESSEQKVEQIESLFGNPFESSMVLLSKVLQLKPGGLGGMVNSNWKNVLAVVTKEGNFHVFLLVEANPSPKEAFKSLYPPMTFESVESWTRKVDIIKSLTPTTSLDLKKCSISISTLQKRQFDVVEERPAATTGGSRFMNAVNAGTQRQKKCTLRLASATEASEWVSLLERTKKALGAMNSTGTRKTNRFRF